MSEKSLTFYTGEWRLQKKDISIPGKLFIDNESKKIHLELYTGKYFDNTPVNHQNVLKKDHKFHLQINGRIKTSELITLCSCLLIRTESIGGELSKLTYKVEYVFLNAHLKDITKLKIKTLDIIYPYLSAFFDGYDFFEKDDLENQTERTLKSNPIIITQNFKIIIIDEYFRKYSNINNSFQMKHIKSLKFQYNYSEDFDSVYNDCSSFAKLLSFNTKKDIGFKINHLLISKSETENYDKNFITDEDDIFCKVINFKNHKNLNSSKNFIHQNKMYFSKDNTYEELNSIIKKWFNNKYYIPIYDFYIDSNNWFQGKDIILSNVMFNNKFLNLIQGLESYYDLLDLEFIRDNDSFTKNRQKVVNKIEDKILQKWLIENLKFPKTPSLAYKLDYLINELKEIDINLNQFEIFLNEYPNKAKDYRHKLSHGRIETTYQGKEFERVFYFSKILLCFCILKTLGLNNLKLKNILKSNYNINEELHKVILP
jgi:hypothetical protein